MVKIGENIAFPKPASVNFEREPTDTLRWNPNLRQIGFMTLAFVERSAFRMDRKAALLDKHSGVLFSSHYGEHLVVFFARSFRESWF
jgi:hypothetical protein